MLECDYFKRNTFFEDSVLERHIKAEMLQELEKKMEKDEHRIYRNNYRNTAIIVDLMTAIRKVPLNKFSCSGDALECMWNMLTKVSEANQIGVVFDS